MTIEQDFLPYAVGGSANVLSQAAYAALTSLLQNGLTSGIVPSNELNKILRQPSIMASVIGQFIVAETGQPAIDDGTTATLLANFTAAVVAASKQQVILTDTGAANAYAAANAVPLTALPTVSGVAQKFQVAHSNTGASTYAPDGLAAHPIFGLGGLALQGGEMPAGGVAGLVSYVGPLLNSGALCWVLYDCTGGAEQIAPATQPAHAVQLGQVAVFGAVRNLKASLAATGTSLTFTADAVVVKSALNGISTLLTSFNQTVSTAAGTGAGKMDTGTAPVSGYVAVYASWGPVVGAGAFLQNATSAAASEQYGGANLPAGVTETQLIGVWPTNGSGQFAVGFQEDRSVSITFVGVLSSTVTQASPTALSISSAVPANAKVAIGTIAASSTAASNMSVSVFASSAAVGQQGINFISSAAGSSISTGYRVPISTSQNLFYIAVNTAGTPTFSMTVTGYEF